MELNPIPIPWDQSENCLFLNPKLPLDARQSLQKLAEDVVLQLDLKSHLVLASSGSTVADSKFLKLVFLSQSAFLASAQAVVDRLNVRGRDTWLQWLPRFHVGGLSIEARQKISGGRILSENEWDVLRFRELCENEAFNLVSLVPTQLFDIVEAQIRSPISCRALILGGGRAEPHLLLAARELGWPIQISFGMTETSSMVSLSTDEFLNPLAGVRLQTNSEQRLGISAPGLATALAQSTSSRPNLQILKDGIFWTEDLAESVDGRWRLRGRASDFVKIGGEGTDLAALRNLWEKILHEAKLPQNKSVLLASPSERLGHEIHLVIEREVSSENWQSLQDLFASSVLPNQRIRQVEVIEQIPRSALGKVLWKKLEQILEGRSK